MITNIPIDDVPKFKWNEENWFQCVTEFLLSKGWATIIIKREAFDQRLASMYAFCVAEIPVIMTGKSPRYDRDHCVVQVGEKIYDPHESDDGVKEPMTDIIALVPVGAFKEDS